MLINELQRTVLLEFMCLISVCAIILFSFRRWKAAIGVASAIATASFFSVWSFSMAAGAFLAYTSASMLLWLQLNKKDTKPVKKLEYLQITSWSLLAIGVTTLILKNIYNIFVYLAR